MAGSDSPRKIPSTALWLGLFFLAALALRFAFSVDTGFDDGAQRQIFTGNDPYYHDRSLRHLLETGENLNFDPAINYPEGRTNPNPPLFIWTTAPLAVALDAMGADDPTGTALNVMTAVWGALIIVPIYLIGRDLWGRTAALWAAFFGAVSGPYIQRSIWGYADHDAITMFLITLAFAFMVKAFRALHVREYVATWKTAAARSSGLKAVFASNRTAFLWAALAGASLTATALVWKGYPYALAVMAVAVGFQLIADHLRNRDSTPTYLLYLLPLAMVVVLPWLLYYRLFPEFLDGTVFPSLYVLIGVLVAGLVLVPTREIPSIVVFPALLVAGLVGLALLIWVFPAAGYQVFSGLGYFNQSKLYTTIAEAQRAQLGFVAASFGFFTFLFGFYGFWQALKGAWRGEPGFMLVAAWGVVAFYMAFAASRFVMNAVPVFALFIGVFMAWLFARLGFAAGRGAATYGQRAERSWGKWTLAAVAVAFLVLPNAWMGVDAGMSSEYEQENDLSNHWFGAFGISFDLKDNGWLDTMDYLAQRDTEVPLEDRPAVIAWWDYGHWNVALGGHPTVADPFQSHFELAGRFLASESEEEAMSWLAILLAHYDYHKDGEGFSPAVASALDGASPGLSSEFPAWDYDEQYEVLDSHVNGTAIFPLYDALAAATGKKVGYMAADIRMYPFGAQSSGIFYAPVFLANKNPDDFLVTQVRSGATTLTIQQYGVDEDGDSYRLERPRYVDGSGTEWVVQNGYAYRPGQTPLDGFAPNSGIPLFGGGEQLIPTERFTNSMYARAYGSYDPSVPAGQGLSHWRVVQQSVGPYFSLPSARETVLLEYYTGVDVSGRVVDESGAPMGGVQVTFLDRHGAAHGIATTDANGTYAVVAPFSDDGDLRLAVLAGGVEVYNTTAVQPARGETQPRTGVELRVPFAAVSGVVFEDKDGNGFYNAGNDTALADATVTAGGRTTTTGDDGRYSFSDVPAGLVTVTASHAGHSNATQQVPAKAGQSTTRDIPMSVRSSTVTLRFEDGGQPVSQVPLTITGAATRTVTTNAQGNATAILAPGEYHVRVDYNVTANGTTERYVADQDFVVPAGGAPMTVVVTRVES